ncbi:MAG: hypothetical protein KJP13_04350 [Altererythrobacter sp.]|nr:hypothetical protein [Altererythrobacter sp.]
MIRIEFGKRMLFAMLGSLGLYACFGGSEEAPGEVLAFDEISESEVITALGNEPFWNAVIEADTLTYSTPENIGGQAIAVTRFAGNGGLGFSGQLNGEPFNLAVTPGECSDTMSDRSYPYTVTLTIDAELRNGCAYTDSQMFTDEGAI